MCSRTSGVVFGSDLAVSGIARKGGRGSHVGSPVSCEWSSGERWREFVVTGGGVDDVVFLSAVDQWVFAFEVEDVIPVVDKLGAVFWLDVRQPSILQGYQAAVVPFVERVGVSATSAG